MQRNMTLTSKQCVPCEGTVPALTKQEIASLLQECAGWEINAGKLHKEYQFKNYKETFAFVTKVAALAEQEGHHPDIWFTWGKAIIELYTHAIKGLSENDFILAAKIKELQ